MKKIFILCISTVFSAIAFAAEHPLWTRNPAISPDGKSIVFSYKGDLYKVSSTGGDAYPLTIHEAHDFMPVWSKDGKWIAFSSDRFGNFDVFIMPAEGGEAKRLTFNSAADFPYDFSADNKKVLFGTPRNDVYTSVRFPIRGLFLKLYSVPVSGGRSVMELSAGTEYARINSSGDKIIFQDRKGYEDDLRKHHTSSVTRDIWIYDLKKKDYTKVSDYEVENREPVWNSDGKSFYYLSERNGSQNIFKSSESSTPVQVSNFKTHPVRHLTISKDNTLTFSYNGEIYTLKEGEQPKKVNIRIAIDNKFSDVKIVPVNSGVTQTDLSPNGKEIAFVVRGEIFVTSVEGGITKRITNTPQQERTVKFSPDGRSLIYATERDGSWDIYKASISRAEEPYFYASTVLKEEPVIATDKDEFQPILSPDGKEVAYLEERNSIKVYNFDSKKTRTILPLGINFSYSDGDQYFDWSPDGKYIVFQSNEGKFFNSEIAAIKADGKGERINITQSGFIDGMPKFSIDGKAIFWLTDKDGKQPLAFQGARETDVYAMFFDQETFDRFNLTKDEFNLLKEKEEKEKKDTTKKATPGAKASDFEPDFEGIYNRKKRITINSSNISSFLLSKEGDKLFFMARMDAGYDLWQVDTRTKETKVLAKLSGGPGGLDLSKDEKSIYVISGGRITKVEVGSGKISPVVVNGEMELNAAKERAYILEHAYRQVAKKFYDPKIHGIDWKMYFENYSRFLPYINNNYDFQQVLSEFLGELNASHTGGRYSPQAENGDATASLGLFFDETTGEKGLKVMEVIEGGPVDLASSKIKKGVVITKIDGIEISENSDWAILLNRKAGKPVLLTLSDPSSKNSWEEVIKPISGGQEQGLLYKRWVKTMRDKVHELSGGKVGYVHVQGMNDGSYRTVYEEVLGRESDKQALIVDTRFNGGGWLHDDLVTFLGGKRYFSFAPYGTRTDSGDPINKWTKPSTVLMSESNYSDAFLFPYAYKSLNIGKLIGMPVAGTGTAVWWEQQIDPTIVFGIPMIATIGKEDRPTENLQLEPDIKVDNDFKSVLAGHDKQLERAVQEMMKEIATQKKAF